MYNIYDQWTVTLRLLAAIITSLITLFIYVYLQLSVGPTLNNNNWISLFLKCFISKFRILFQKESMEQLLLILFFAVKSNYHH